MSQVKAYTLHQLEQFPVVATWIYVDTYSDSSDLYKCIPVENL